MQERAAVFYVFTKWVSLVLPGGRVWGATQSVFPFLSIHADTKLKSQESPALDHSQQLLTGPLCLEAHLSPSSRSSSTTSRVAACLPNDYSV